MYETRIYQDEEGTSVIARDVTELKEAESTARRNELRWQFAVEGAGDGLWDWDATTGEVYFSSRWKSMLGFGDHEIASRLEEWSERVHPDDLEHTMAALNRHLDGTTPDYVSEHRLRCKDGSYKWILDRGRVVSRADDGSPVRAIGTHTDITEEKEAHRRIQRLLEEKDNLLHEVHHRIKNSFASVESLLQIGAAEATHPETRTAILAARSRVTSTRVLYETLLQAERYETVPVHEYLTDIVHAAIAAGNGTREARIDLDLEIAHLELSPRTAFPVGAIVTELVTNSLKYAFGDASDGRVGVRLDTAGSAMTITVDDDGAGFTPPQEGRNERMHGLVLVEMMANQLDGEFTLRSEPGVGTRGTLIVPLPADGGRTVAGRTE
jgi:PAS domain S-box-containing protein